MQTLFFWLGLIFAAATCVFFWASIGGAGWAASLCGDAPITCTNWQMFGYAAGVLLIGYLAMVLTS